MQSGVRIKSFSALGSIIEYYLQPFGSTDQDEDEFMLPPGMTFMIDAIETFTNGVTQVKMHEVSLWSESPKKRTAAHGYSHGFAELGGLTSATGDNAATIVELDQQGAGYLDVEADGPQQLAQAHDHVAVHFGADSAAGLSMGGSAIPPPAIGKGKGKGKV